jgi:hypothetical protein
MSNRRPSLLIQDIIESGNKSRFTQKTSRLTHDAKGNKMRAK